MIKNNLHIRNIVEGKNSVLFETSKKYILYEKLLNTIHVGSNELKILQNKIESVSYNPSFESDSLILKKEERLENLVLNVTESCNLSCSYCIYSGKYENERIENNLNMNFEIARIAINFFVPRSRNPALISFYGGEPLNNICLIKKVINYTKRKFPDRNFAFSMTSNFCDSNLYIDDLIKNNIYVSISLDGPKEIHDKNRKFKNGEPTYEKIIENLNIFYKVSPEYVKNHISFNTTHQEKGDLKKIVKFFQKNKLLKFSSSRISGIEVKGLQEEIIFEKTRDLFSLSLEYVNSILNRKEPGILRGLFDQKLKNIAFRSKEAMPKKLMLEGCCYPGKRKLFVNTKGDFYMCERFGKRIQIGDVNEGLNESRIAKSIETFLDIRNSLCVENCWAQRICSPCIQASKDPKKDISREGLLQTCVTIKSQILIALSQYTYLFKEKDILNEYITTINTTKKVNENG